MGICSTPNELSHIFCLSVTSAKIPIQNQWQVSYSDTQECYTNNLTPYLLEGCQKIQRKLK